MARLDHVLVTKVNQIRSIASNLLGIIGHTDTRVTWYAQNARSTSKNTVY